jgi:hypothetical protein
LNAKDVRLAVRTITSFVSSAERRLQNLVKVAKLKTHEMPCFALNAEISLMASNQAAKATTKTSG